MQKRNLYLYTIHYKYKIKLYNKAIVNGFKNQLHRNTSNKRIKFLNINVFENAE